MMTVTLRKIPGSLPDEERRRAVYGGDLLVFEGVTPLGELCVYADSLIRDTFGVPDPLRAQFELARDEYLFKVETLQKWFRKDGKANELFLSALEHVGVNLRRAFWDWLYLRVAPHGEEYASRRTAGLGFHRDTWSSNVYAQTNWWTPIYPITCGRTIAFYPDYWSRPVRNSSGDWDLEKVRSGEITTLVPEPAEPIETDSELRIVIEPGDLLCFSGAHLHASVPNATGVARFSVEVRTVDATDAVTGRGAPNVDGVAPRVASGWFRQVHDGTPLPELVERKE